MLLNNHTTKDLLLCIPVIAFMSIIDKAVWPLILVLAVPVVLARYYPSKLLQNVKRSIREGASNQLNPVLATSALIKPVHLIIVASAICLLNTSPKKLEKPTCNMDMAINMQQLPTLPLQKTKVISLLIPTGRFD